MTDIVKKLRNHYDYNPLIDALCGVNSVGDALDAADEIERLRRERDEARRIIAECINQGTDGNASADCSMEFLSHAPTECAAIKRQRDEARQLKIHAEETLTGVKEHLAELKAERDEARAAEKSLHDRLRCLEDAVDQCLDDMGKHGHSVCGAAKAQLRHALGPDYLTDDERHISYVEAVRILIECDELHGKRSSLRDELAQIEDRTP
jgi:hypothetical protein